MLSWLFSIFVDASSKERMAFPCGVWGGFSFKPAGVTTSVYISIQFFFLSEIIVFIVVLSIVKKSLDVVMFTILLNIWWCGVCDKHGNQKSRELNYYLKLLCCDFVFIQFTKSYNVVYFTWLFQRPFDINVRPQERPSENRRYRWYRAHRSPRPRQVGQKLPNLPTFFYKLDQVSLDLSFLVFFIFWALSLFSDLWNTPQIHLVIFHSFF